MKKTGTVSVGNVSPLTLKWLSNTENFLLLISPFIKESTFFEVFNKLETKPSKIVVVSRWLPKDLLSGVSDVSVYTLVKKYGGEMYINDHIHAKLYISDYDKALIGSANLTDKGLGFSSDHNIEALASIDCNEDFLSSVNDVIDASAKLDDEMVSYYKEFVDTYKHQYSTALPEGAIEFYKKIKQRIDDQERGGLFVHDFPLTKPVADADVQDRQIFLKSPAYIWQKRNITKPTSFGEYSELLHNALSDVPTPYRKQVKDLVACMYDWTKAFSDEFVFEAPNHSEIIKPK